MHDHQTRPTKPVVQPLVKEGGEAAVQAAPAGQEVLQLQRRHGNRYVQRMVALARQAAGQAEGGELDPEVESSIQRARGGGQALDGGVRAQMEPALGADLSGVRVHTGAEADRLNRAVSARAFTTGNDVFFRQGEYSPGSSSGRELLAHELTHAVQQGGSPVQAKLTLGAVNTPEEREADEVARQMARGEAGGVRAAGEGGGGTVQRAPLRYNVTPVKVTPPPKPTTLAQAQDAVDRRKSASPADLTSGSIKGATASSEAEIFLWYILAAQGIRDNWGTETDMIAPIGWPAKAGDPHPVGKVTVTIDDTGNGVAELLSAGATTAPGTYATVTDAEKELQKTYGIASVKNGDAKWSPEDLNKVIGAFALLPAADVAALAGVDLLRVQSLGGTTAGEFDSSESASGTTATVTATIKLSNRAFNRDDKSFVGSGASASPMSYMTIVHEVGHAIATKARRDAGAANVRSVAKTNQLVGEHADALTETAAALSEYNAAVDVYNDASKARDRAGMDAAKKVVDEKKKVWDAAKKAEAAKKSAVEAGKKSDTATETAKAATMAGTETKRVQAFVDLVNKKGIKPFTDYAKDHWPHKPEEFYAEVYALWLTDPAFLKTNYPDLFTWFATGKYKK